MTNIARLALLLLAACLASVGLSGTASALTPCPDPAGCAPGGSVTLDVSPVPNPFEICLAAQGWADPLFAPASAVAECASLFTAPEPDKKPAAKKPAAKKPAAKKPAAKKPAAKKPAAKKSSGSTGSKTGGSAKKSSGGSAKKSAPKKSSGSVRLPVPCPVIVERVPVG